MIRAATAAFAAAIWAVPAAAEIEVKEITFSRRDPRLAGPEAHEIPFIAIEILFEGRPPISTTRESAARST